MIAAAQPDGDDLGLICTEFFIRGRVQGVGFRWWTRNVALELGIRGTARNRRDGSVHVFAGGTRDAMRSFARRLSDGPPGAAVSSVEEVHRQDAISRLPSDFRILH